MGDVRTKIARWTREGASLELIEERLGGLPASEEEKSALWLWAWSCRALMPSAIEGWSWATNPLATSPPAR